MSDITTAPALIAPRRSDRACRLLHWSPVDNNPSLIARATVSFAGLIVVDVPIFRKGDNSLSVGVPSCPKLDAEGRVKLKPNGKRDYAALIRFESGTEAQRRWDHSILSALADAGIGGGDAS